MFCPKPPYLVVSRTMSLLDFWKLPNDYFRLRKEHPQKSEWNLTQKQAFMMSLFRQSYIPRLVLREIRLDNENIAMEILDGHQRIQTLIEFWADQFQPMPTEFAQLFPEIILDDPIESYRREDYISSRITFYPTVESFFKYNANIHFDIIRGIDNTSNQKHEDSASELHKLLQH